LAIRGIPYSAQDFVGLLYETLGKGKLGDAQMAWWKKHLLDPYARAMNDIDIMLDLVLCKTTELLKNN
jgi:hypothetical protein